MLLVEGLMASTSGNKYDAVLINRNVLCSSGRRRQETICKETRYYSSLFCAMFSDISHKIAFLQMALMLKLKLSKV